MTIEELQNQLHKSEEQSREARLRMAPLSRVESLRQEKVLPSDAQQSAVLVLLAPPGGQESYSFLDCSLLLTRRNTYEGVHSGQISFPGGKREPSDKSFEETALREAQEEMGVLPENVSLAGRLLPLYIPPSHFVLYPIVGLLTKPQSLTPDPREVADYRWIPLRDFINPEHQKLQKVRLKENLYTEAPSYCLGDYCIWGATAMVVGDLTA